MTSTKYVKCEDCGRRLPGPPRKCDVCGGRMTYNAENSYYTPEGIVYKSHHGKSAQNTPDGSTKPKAKMYSKPSGSKSSEAVPTRTAKTTEKPLIDRIGEAVDILAGSEELNTDSLKEMGKAISGKNDDWTNISDGSISYDETSDQKQDEYSYDNRKKKMLVKYAVWAVIFIIGIAVFALDAYNDSNYNVDDYDDINYEGSDYASLDVEEAVAGEGYTLRLNDVTLENMEGETDYFYVTFTVEMDEDYEMTIYPYSSTAVELDGFEDMELEYVDIINEDTFEEYSYYDDTDRQHLRSGESYTFTLCYLSIPEWDQLTFIHNFTGSLSERDESLDITVERP